MFSKHLIVILGPTATGKTSLSARLAMQFNGEIISADSRQVYKRMNLGTGKDYEDYLVDGKSVEVHLIDIAEPTEEYNLFRFLKDYTSASGIIKGRGKIPFLVGGTGLYIDAVLRGYELKEVKNNGDDDLRNFSMEELRGMLSKLTRNVHNTTDLHNKDRLIRAIQIARQGASMNAAAGPNALVIGIAPSREIVKKRIHERLKKRLETGMIDEVKDLLASGVAPDKLRSFGLEYKYITMYLEGELNYNDMFQKLNSSIADFAKRQMTWFRKMERSGLKINWIESADQEKAGKIIKGSFLE